MVNIVMEDFASNIQESLLCILDNKNSNINFEIVFYKMIFKIIWVLTLNHFHVILCILEYQINKLKVQLRPMIEAEYSF